MGLEETQVLSIPHTDFVFNASLHSERLILVLYVFLGLKGLQGTTGERGTPGFSGIEGKKGEPGDPGISGYPGKKTKNWLNSLVVVF